MMASIYNFTGFHTSATIRAEIPPSTPLAYNITLLLANIPLFALAAGVSHIYIGVTSDRLEHPLSRVGLVARGILECIGLGLLFLIPDLIVSMHRHFCASRPPLTSTHRVND